MTISSRLGDARRVAALASSRDELCAAVGVHPHEAAGYADAHEADLRAVAASSGEKIRAIGEIGLDYHYEHSPRDVQQADFRRQLRLARALALPVVVHTREAEDDTASILEDEGAGTAAGGRGGVLHCFTSSARLAERCLAL